MTELELYTSALIEQNKLESPTLTIEEYNYLINKAIVQYINLNYAKFDLNQQSSDDLRWLQESVELDIFKQGKIIPPMEEANYACLLPINYFHVLNCSVHFSPKSCYDDSKNCKPGGDDGKGGIFSMCRRLTANQFPAIINNAYLRPTYRRPYFYINNSDDAGKVSTELLVDAMLDPCPCPDGDNNPIIWRGDLERIINRDTEPYPTIDIGGRKIMEIRCGRNSNVYPDVAYVDYLRLPRKIELTWDQIQSVEDTTALCEFPDAVGYEIINLFVKLLLENASDDRLKTHYAVNQTVGGGTQQVSK